jgi:hypothetical protein
LQAIDADNWHQETYEVAAGVGHQSTAKELSKMIFQELSTQARIEIPLVSDADWVKKTMCFSPDEVPRWLKLRKGSFNVAPEIECRLNSSEKRHGNCYKLALLGCLHGGENWTLVHGETVGPLGISRMNHAWLERDGWVYDPVLDRVWPWAVYARISCAVPISRYSHAEAWQLAEDTGHCGPWQIGRA